VSYISPSARRRAAFVKAAGEIYDYLEQWYIQNPDASPHEIALETLRRRQQLMRKAVALLGSGQSHLYSASRGPGFKPQPTQGQMPRPTEPGFFLDLLV